MKRRITREIRRGIERVIILLLLSVLCNHNFVFFRGDTICERKGRKGKEEKERRIARRVERRGN